MALCNNDMTQKDPVSGEFERGVQRYQDGEYDLALEHFLKIETDPIQDLPLDRSVS